MKKNLLLLFAALFISLALAEIICRVNGKYLTYTERTGMGGYTSPFKDNAKGWTRTYLPHETLFMSRNEFSDSFIANEDGLKDKDILPYKKEKRILILGDSFTEGVGAVADSSYPRILESLFKGDNDSSVQVINAGIGGSDLFYEYKLLLALSPKYKPDIVIVTCNPSDIFEYFTRGGFERFAADSDVQYRSGPWFEPIYAHSSLARLLIHDVFEYDFNFIRHKDYKNELAKAEKEMCAVMDSLNLFCRVNHISFGMVFHPFYPDIQHPDLYSMKNLVAYCSAKNIPCTDAMDFLTQKGINDKNCESIYWKMDGHFNGRGYELLAQCVHQFLEQQNWLSEAR